MSDTTLADLAPTLDDAAGEGSVDVTQDVSAEDFDIDAFVAGVRPSTRAVKIYARADLLAPIAELEERIRRYDAQVDAGEDPDEDRDDLIEQIEALQDEFLASGKWFHVRGRSDAWRDGVKKKLKKAGASENDIVLEQVAASIVIPSGVTKKHLKAIQEINEAEVKKLVVAWQFACTQPTKATAPFSREPSRSRRG